MAKDGNRSKRSKIKKIGRSRDKEALDQARRTTLKRLGMFGAFTAPAILSMTLTDRAAAQFVDSGDTL
jgi:hypothetical protein